MTDQQDLSALVEKWDKRLRELGVDAVSRAKGGAIYQCLTELREASAQLPAGVPDGWVLVPIELAERVDSALGRFCGDEGWTADDMGTMDDFGAIVNAAPQPDSAAPEGESGDGDTHGVVAWLDNGRLWQTHRAPEGGPHALVLAPDSAAPGGETTVACAYDRNAHYEGTFSDETEQVAAVRREHADAIQLLQETCHTIRVNKPTGQWPGERVALAIDEVLVALLAPSVAAPGGDVEQRARELLATEYERGACYDTAERIRRHDPLPAGWQDDCIAIRAIIAALSAPSGVAWNVLTIGNYGAAYDMMGTHRAFTYKHQPGNVDASRLGSALTTAANASYGDSTDRGLSLLKALEESGFGVFQIGDTSAALSAPKQVGDDYQMLLAELASPQAAPVPLEGEPGAWRSKTQAPWMNCYAWSFTTNPGDVSPDHEPLYTHPPEQPAVALSVLRQLRSYEYKRGDLIHQRHMGEKCMCKACIESRADALIDGAKAGRQAAAPERDGGE